MIVEVEDMTDPRIKTMREFYIHYYTKTLLTIGDWKEWVQTPLPAWRFNFGDGMVAMRDCVRQEGANKLHLGLEFIVQTHATNEEEAKDKSKIFVESILNFISFSTLSSCDAVSIINIIEIKRDTNLSPFQHYIYPFKDDFIIGSSVKIDEAVFSEIWNKYNKNEHQQRLMRAMSWFRKGLNETGLDEFISYWIGVEILRGILKSDADAELEEELDKDVISRELIEKFELSTKEGIILSSNAVITKEKEGKWIISDGRKYDLVWKKGMLNIYKVDKKGSREWISNEWIGVIKVFEDKLRCDDFGKIKDIRNGILHGYEELSTDFVKKAVRYIPSLRKGLIACISTILDISDEISNKIVNKEVRRVKLEQWQIIKGNFENLPSTFDGMIINYPKIEVKIKDKEMNREKDGRLNITSKLEHTFLSGGDIKFKIKEVEVWGDKQIEKGLIEIKED